LEVSDILHFLYSSALGVPCPLSPAFSSVARIYLIVGTLLTFILCGRLFFLTGTIIVGLAASLTNTIHYVSPTLTGSTTTGLAHGFSPPLHIYSLLWLVFFKLSQYAI